MTGYLEMHDIPVMGYEVPESKLYSHEAEYAVIGAMIQKGDLIEGMGAKLEVSTSITQLARNCSSCCWLARRKVSRSTS